MTSRRRLTGHHNCLSQQQTTKILDTVLSRQSPRKKIYANIFQSVVSVLSCLVYRSFLEGLSSDRMWLLVYSPLKLTLCKCRVFNFVSWLHCATVTLCAVYGAEIRAGVWFTESRKAGGILDLNCAEAPPPPITTYWNNTTLIDC